MGEKYCWYYDEDQCVAGTVEKPSEDWYYIELRKELSDRVYWVDANISIRAIKATGRKSLRKMIERVVERLNEEISSHWIDFPKVKLEEKYLNLTYFFDEKFWEERGVDENEF